MKLSPSHVALLTAATLAFSTGAKAQFSPQSLSSTPPTSEASPAILNQGQSYLNALTFSITFGQLGVSITSIEIRGTIPPGLSTGGTQVGDANVVSSRPNVTFFGTPTTPGDYRLSVNAITSTGLNSVSQVSPWEVFIRVVASGPVPVAPAFTQHPQSQTVRLGSPVTLTAVADGTPPPTYQWFHNGSAIGGATAASLSISAVSAASAGTYSVVATNSAGSATSNPATLTVDASSPPAITIQPIGVTVLPGGTVALVTGATGSPAPTFQWKRGNTAIPGANSSTLVLPRVSAADVGDYTADATNSAGTATSRAARVSVGTGAEPGRIINLSILTEITAAERLFTLGVVIGGSGTAGSKPLLIRAAGPSLAPLGVPGVLGDPRLEVFSGQTSIAVNDNWGGGATLVNAFAAVGAFAYVSPSSLDSAHYTPSTPPGAYTVQVRGTEGATGAVIAELYDSTAPTSFTATTPRLINVSVLKHIPTRGVVTAGFVLGGSAARTVLIRAIGPTLGSAPFNLEGVLADPKLELFSGQSAIASNDNWGGDAQLAAAGSSVGAFAVAVAASRDAMLLITLPPGAYTAQAGGVGDASGLAIVEVYEVP